MKEETDIEMQASADVKTERLVNFLKYGNEQGPDPIQWLLEKVAVILRMMMGV